MPSLAEADTVIASEASSAATIRTKRLIRFVSPSRDRDEAQFPDEWICSVVLKLISQGYSSIGYRYSRRCDAGRRRGLESFRHAVPAGMVVKKSAWQFSGKNGKEGLMTYGESWMNSPDIAEAAFARAWGVYLLIHSGSTRMMRGGKVSSALSASAAKRVRPTRNCWRSRGSNI